MTDPAYPAPTGVDISRPSVARMYDFYFSGLDLVDPGVVTVDAWQPDPSDPAPEATRWLYGAVGRKG